MAVTKEKKKEILEKIQDIISKSQSVVFAHFSGLGVSLEQAMRQELKAQGVGYTVVKKRLAKKAFGDSSIEGDMPILSGELALVYGEDQIAPARELHAFAKKYKDQLSIMGGVFENKYMSQSEMMTIATIPPLNTLYGMFANIINSPIQGLVIALNEVANKKEA